MSGDLMPYSGLYSTHMDDKRRIVIPSEIRSVFTQRSPYSGFWAVPDRFKGNPYLLCYDIAYFKKDAPLLDMKQSEFCKVDSQGRTILKEWQETIAGIRRGAIVAASGDGETFEIWEPEMFELTHEKSALEKLASAARRFIRAS